MAPWFTWVFLLHPLRIVYALVLPQYLMGIAATGLLVVMMLPVYIAMICALLIALLESLGACQRWRRGEVVVSREEFEAYQQSQKEREGRDKEEADAPLASDSDEAKDSKTGGPNSTEARESDKESKKDA